MILPLGYHKGEAKEAKEDSERVGAARYTFWQKRGALNLCIRFLWRQRA